MGEVYRGTLEMFKRRHADEGYGKALYEYVSAVHDHNESRRIRHRPSRLTSEQFYILTRLRPGDIFRGINRYKGKEKHDLWRFYDISGFYIRLGAESSAVVVETDGPDLILPCGPFSGFRFTLSQMRDIACSVAAVVYLLEFNDYHAADYARWRAPPKLPVTFEMIGSGLGPNIEQRRKALLRSCAAKKSTTSLYRHFAANGELLYVGISCNFVNRLGQHRDGSSWYKLIKFVTVEHFATREEAEAAERRAIRTEFPLFNRQHSVLDIAA